MSGRFVLRLSPQLHETLRGEASREGLSLNTLCRQILEHHARGGSKSPDLGEMESGLVTRIAQAFGASLQGVILFGSVARGTARMESDIDLLIVFSADKVVTRRLYAQWDEWFAGNISPHFVQLPANAADAGTIWLESSVDGVVWYDRDGGVSRFLAEIRRMIAGGQFSRREAYGLPYWVRKNGDHDVQRKAGF
jgi:hypothetical protein